MEHFDDEVGDENSSAAMSKIILSIFESKSTTLNCGISMFDTRSNGMILSEVPTLCHATLIVVSRYQALHVGF